MANKKFRGINGTVELPEVEQDFENAKRFDSIWVGDLGVYYKEGFKTVYLAYPEIERAFIRIQEVNGKLCCGNAVFAYSRLVFIAGGKEYSGAMSEKEDTFDEALALIAEKSPSTAIGVA